MYIPALESALVRVMHRLRAADDLDAYRAADALGCSTTVENVVFAITIAAKVAPDVLHDLGHLLTTAAEPGGDPPQP